MLPLGKIMEIEKLLAEGRLSQRKIAHTLGVGRATVNAIALGKRPNYEDRMRERVHTPEYQGPIERCPGCGGRVYMPCRLCRVRQLQAQEHATLTVLRQRARRQAVERLVQAVRDRATAESLSPQDLAGGLP